MSHHRRALAVLSIAAVLDAVLGVAFAAADHISIPDGLFFALTTATTVGYGDITAHGWLSHTLTVIMMLTIIPLFAAAFSLLTSGLTAAHVEDSEKRIKAHIEHHLGGHREPQD